MLITSLIGQKLRIQDLEIPINITRYTPWIDIQKDLPLLFQFFSKVQNSLNNPQPITMVKSGIYLLQEAIPGNFE